VFLFFLSKNTLFIANYYNSFYNVHLFSILNVLQDLWPIIRVKRNRPSIFKGNENHTGWEQVSLKKFQWTRLFRVSKEINETCLFEPKLQQLFNKTFLLTMIIFKNSLTLKTPSLKFPTACSKFYRCGSRDKCLFSVIRGHLYNVIINYNNCFNKKTLIKHFCLKTHINSVKDQTKSLHIWLSIAYKTKQNE